MNPKYGFNYSIYYCTSCYNNILKHLESSVEMPTRIDICNSLVFQRFSVEGITAKVNAKLQKWKFTNDSRREIIREIKKTQSCESCGAFTSSEKPVSIYCNYCKKYYICVKCNPEFNDNWCCTWCQ